MVMQISEIQGSGSEVLAPNTRIVTEFGRELRIIKRIGGGGQGSVYEVQCDGKSMALKWFDPAAIWNRELFVSNLRKNIMRGAPAPEFLWPQDITKEYFNSFGYLMELCPKDYMELGDTWVKPTEGFSSFHRSVDVCLGIVKAFNVLHNAGYRYQDLNGGNFFVNTHTGKVLIADNDNVAPVGGDTGMRGYPTFMAPEIVMGSSVPSIQSDLHSMSVVIFNTLVLQHPLQGKKFALLPMDEAAARYIYGTNPVFIFDPTDRSNAAIQSPQNNALRIWPCLPDHMKKIFERAFSSDALHKPALRPVEMEWMRELVQFRSEIVRCHCGNEVFLQGTNPRRCDNCGAICGCQMCMEASGMRIPLVDDARMYRCQLKVCNEDQALEPYVWVLASKQNPKSFGLRNMSHQPWEARVEGHVLQVAPGKTIRAVDGMELSVLGQTVRICKNTK